MAHKVKVAWPILELGGQDVHIYIEKDSEKIGELLISKGNIEWWPKGHSRRRKRFTWREFQYYIETHGKTIKS